MPIRSDEGASCGVASQIRLHKLTKRYGTVTAVDDLSLTISALGVFGLLGPNGAGKTTTLEMIEGLRQPDSGEVWFGSLDVVRHPQQAKARFGIQLQTSSFFDLLTVAETLDLFASFYPKRLATAELIARFDLGEKAQAQVKTLSGGQRQRLALAAAMVNDPEVVFLDEPSAGLDPQARRHLWELVHGLRDEGRTVVLTTHYMEEAETLCDELAIIDHGRILATGRPKELISERMPGALIELAPDTALPAQPHFAAMTALDRTKDAITIHSSDLSKTLVDLVSWASQSTVDLAGIRTRSSTLEDLFLSLTGRSLRE